MSMMVLTAVEHLNQAKAEAINSERCDIKTETGAGMKKVQTLPPVGERSASDPFHIQMLMSIVVAWPSAAVNQIL